MKKLLSLLLSLLMAYTLVGCSSLIETTSIYIYHSSNSKMPTILFNV